ncbi:MAG: hypothetical protein MUC88_25730 [Planctomycetes bacterium]|nr:hypothetical protein [Planctomycetota bacterium]
MRTTGAGTAVGILLLLGFATVTATAEVCNLKVVTDASPDYTDLGSMIHSITARWPSPQEKCWALFYWTHIARRQTNPMHLHGLECTDPIRQFNDYGYTMCSTVAGINCSVWDALGYPVKFWDISLHTVPEVQYNGRWHMYDNSMSALYTLCDGQTIAAVEDIGKPGGCAASGGRVEPGHIARYHCLNSTSNNGFLTGADCPRDLAQEYRCFNPNGLKYRYYYHNWDRGHRYILNLRENEVYTRYYQSLGDSPEYYVPNNGKDPEKVNPRYRLRGNGRRIFQPALTENALKEAAYSISGCTALRPSGVVPAKAATPGEIVFKIQGANVITQLRINASFVRRAPADVTTLAISTTNGLTWTDLWRGEGVGEVPLDLVLGQEVNGAYEVLVKVVLLGQAHPADACLKSIEFETITMLNSKTQPQLLLGRNTVYVGTGAQTESIVVWPDLQGDTYQPFVVEQKNMSSKAKHPGYQGVMYATRAKEDAYVVFRVEAPTDITCVNYGGRFYNRAASFDGGKTWQRSYSLDRTTPPWDVLHFETLTDIPAGARSVLLKYLLHGSAAGPDACSIYSVRMEVSHQPQAARWRPVEVTFHWSEVVGWASAHADDAQAAAPEQHGLKPILQLVERSHTQLVEQVPARYTIDVGGMDHPIVNSLRVNLAGAAGTRPDPVSPRQTSRSDSIDDKDLGKQKYVGRWVRYGRNLAERKSYTVSVPSGRQWGPAVGRRRSERDQTHRRRGWPTLCRRDWAPLRPVLGKRDEPGDYRGPGHGAALRRIPYPSQRRLALVGCPEGTGPGYGGSLHLDGREAVHQPGLLRVEPAP